VQDDRHAIERVAFSRDRRRLITISTREVVLWDAKSGERQQAFRRNTFLAHAAALSADGQRLAIADGLEVHVFSDLDTDAPAASLKHTTVVEGVEFSSDGSRLVTTDGSGSHLWDTTTFASLGTLVSNGHGPYTAALNHESTLVATLNAVLLQLWDARTGKPVGSPKAALTSAPYTATIQFGSADDRIVVSDFRAQTLWDAGTQTPLGAINSPSGVVRARLDNRRNRLLIASGADPGSGANEPTSVFIVRLPPFPFPDSTTLGGRLVAWLTAPLTLAGVCALVAILSLVLAAWRARALGRSISVLANPG
jgi:WD40 repeat protein